MTAASGDYITPDLKTQHPTYTSRNEMDIDGKKKKKKGTSYSSTQHCHLVQHTRIIAYTYRYIYENAPIQKKKTKTNNTHIYKYIYICLYIHIHKYISIYKTLASRLPTFGSGSNSVLLTVKTASELHTRVLRRRTDTGSQREHSRDQLTPSSRRLQSKDPPPPPQPCQA